jgi:hypothetical protein
MTEDYAGAIVHCIVGPHAGDRGDRGQGDSWHATISAKLRHERLLECGTYESPIVAHPPNIQAH